ncbi:MAG: hypothetical protein JSR36_12770 [Proteobacteria bacterium]|nr:hypothetical protein [Pseudomonadota bacterium]
MDLAYTARQRLRPAHADMPETIARVLKRHWRAAITRQPRQFWQRPARWLSAAIDAGDHQRTSGGRLIR